MHRRARHLNPGSAGAVLALDSRFISGLSDGDPISTWTDRSGNGNNATGSGTARPTFETNEQGGGPVVRFDGVNDHLLFARIDLSASTALASVKRNSGPTFCNVFAAAQVSTSRNSFEVAIHNNLSFGPLITGSNGNTTRYGKGGSLRAGEVRILACQWLGGATDGAANYKIWDDGVEVSLTDTGTITAANASSSLVGAAFSAGSITSYLAGDVSGLSLLPTSVSNSLRRRLEHAAAFAFKIPCS